MPTPTGTLERAANSIVAGSKGFGTPFLDARIAVQRHNQTFATRREGARILRRR
jgi:hypothetical protein